METAESLARIADARVPWDGGRRDVNCFGEHRLASPCAGPGRAWTFGFVYRVGAGEGVQDVISVMEHEWVSKHGLSTEVVLGVIRRPQGFGGNVSPDLFEENPGFVRFLHELIAEHVLELRQVLRGPQGSTAPSSTS